MRRFQTAVLALLLVGVPTAPAQTWTGIFDQSWNHGFNWDNFTAPNSATAAAFFGDSGVGPVNIDTGVQLQSLTFNNTVPVGYAITSSPGQGMTGLAGITVAAGVTATDTINLASVPTTGSLNWPAGTLLKVMNNATLGGAPTLVIGPNTVLGSSVTTGSGVSFTGPGFTRFSGSYASGAANQVNGDVAMNGPGRLELTGNASNFAGNLEVNNGTVAVNSDAAIGGPSSRLYLFTGSATTGGFEFLNGGVTIARPVVLFATTRIISKGTDVNTISGQVSGVGGLVKDGTGTLVLSAVNSFSGGLTINGGTLRINSAADLPSGVAVALGNVAGATLDLNGLNPTIGPLSGGGAAGGTVLVSGGYVAVGDANSSNFAGTLSGAATVQKFGSGTLTLTGAGSKVGSLNVENGTLAVGGGSLTLTANMLPISVSGGVAAALTIGAAGVVSTQSAAQNAYVMIDGPTGTAATVTGAGSQLNVGSSLWVGNVASGSLTVQGGGSVTAGGPLYIGHTTGTGSVLIQSGGNLTAQTVFLAGPGGSGVLTVTGTGSTLSSQVINLGGNGANDQLIVTAGGSVTASAGLSIGAGGALTIDGGTLTVGSLGNSIAPSPTLAISDPIGGLPALTFALSNSNSVYSGPITDATSGPGTLAKTGPGTLTLSGRLTNTGGYAASSGVVEFASNVVQPGTGTLVAATGATIQYDAGTRLVGGYLAGPGTQLVLGNAAMTGTVASISAVITATGPSSFVNFTNGGTMNLLAAQNGPVTLTRFVNQGSGSMTIGQITGPGTVVRASDFQSYGLIMIPPSSGGSASPNLLTNAGSTPLYFNGGSRTFIGTPATAGQNAALVDLHGQNAVVAGGLFVNNGFVGDSTGSGATIVADFGSLVKGAGVYANPLITQNGGKFQAGNSPGKAMFGSFALGPGGVNNYVFCIDDATGTAGPSPDAAGHVSGWGLVKAFAPGALGRSSLSGDFTWTATPADKLTFALETLLNPTTVGIDVPGPMADFDPALSYTWPAVEWSGGYHGPSDAVALNAATTFETTGFLNPIAGTFGWNLDEAGHELSLIYTPSAVPEPGTLALTGLAAIAWVRYWRRRWTPNPVS